MGRVAAEQAREWPAAEPFADLPSTTGLTGWQLCQQPPRDADTPSAPTKGGYDHDHDRPHAPGAAVVHHSRRPIRPTAAAVNSPRPAPLPVQLPNLTGQCLSSVDCRARTLAEGLCGNRPRSTALQMSHQTGGITTVHTRTYIAIPAQLHGSPPSRPRTACCVPPTKMPAATPWISRALHRRPCRTPVIRSSGHPGTPPGRQRSTARSSRDAERRLGARVLFSRPRVLPTDGRSPARRSPR